MSILSPHTTLDAAPGAMSDWLADTVLDPAHPRAADRRAIVPKALPRPSEECKIVTFVPAADVDRVRGALASAGAGIIGPYSACAFFATGTGSFIAGPGARPAVTSGQSRHDGHLELVPEARLEMVLAARSVPLAIELLKRFHPYQEPPIDVYRLEPKPQRSAGAGRRLTLDQPVTIHQLAERVKRALGVSHVQIAPARDPAHKISRVGVCPGAGAGLVDAAAREGCELYLTGEMKHHEVLAANAKGVGILLAGHSNTERGYLPRLAAHLASTIPGATFRHAACDRTLMQTV
jgi:putative NIF3 family GTP cyclohydrolase 1 type 2